MENQYDRLNREIDFELMLKIGKEFFGIEGNSSLAFLGLSMVDAGRPRGLLVPYRCSGVYR